MLLSGRVNRAMYLKRMRLRKESVDWLIACSHFRDTWIIGWIVWCKHNNNTVCQHMKTRTDTDDPRRPILHIHVGTSSKACSVLAAQFNNTGRHSHILFIVLCHFIPHNVPCQHCCNANLGVHAWDGVCLCVCVHICMLAVFHRLALHNSDQRSTICIYAIVWNSFCWHTSCPFAASYILLPPHDTK